jgi:hypothetical protein
MEGVDHLMGSGQDDRVHRGIGVGHVEGPEVDPLLPGPGLFVQPGGHFDIGAARQDVDDLMMLDVDNGRGVVGPVPGQAHEGGLVEPNGAGLVQPFAVRIEEGAAIGGHGVVDRVPVTGELARDLFDRASGAHLDRRPLGRSRGEQAVLGRDAVVPERERLLRALRVHTAQAVLAPGEAHRDAEHRQIDVAHHRALFDLGRPATAWTSQSTDHLLDHQLHVLATALVVQDRDILQTDEGLDDLTRVIKDKGASCLLSHISSLEHLCSIPG